MHGRYISSILTLVDPLITLEDILLTKLPGSFLARVTTKGKTKIMARWTNLQRKIDTIGKIY